MNDYQEHVQLERVNSYHSMAARSSQGFFMLIAFVPRCPSVDHVLAPVH
jgi:hypothetical protein